MNRIADFFKSEEYVDMAKKNVEFAMDMFKTNLKEQETTTKENLGKYFDMVNSNIEVLSKNYDKFVEQGTEVANFYKENVEKTYEISKQMIEKVKNFEAK
ncbi:MAG: ANTH domain-containing protein [Candidatus Muirbacterium halophilum]|nr:ANTH domain-containing protein [Candidatus Muirbacterium halophilum]MCK9476681.1 ANTH domain-containing protein [Candidatus Muirbacterium halophilum]